MELGLAKKTVIVTGGGSNIGRCIFLSFVKEGANVVMAEIDEKQGQKVLDEGKALKASGRLMLVKTDVTTQDAVQAMVKKTLAEFGQIDVLANVVGWTFDRSFIEKPLEEMQKEINLNLWSAKLCVRAVVDNMIARKSGKIVMLASDAGRIGQAKEVVYGAAKGGIIAFTKGLAKELGRYNITVNNICPGATLPDSPEHVGELAMTGPKGFGAMIWQAPPELKQKMASGYPLGRTTHPQDVANAMLFLASDAASFITGQTLSVSGGFSTVG
jgi:2-hydroxycyclohexanecarboxyl-CoA dehydrogenase